jgi:hypothetical protein
VSTGNPVMQYDNAGGCSNMAFREPPAKVIVNNSQNPECLQQLLIYRSSLSKTPSCLDCRKVDLGITSATWQPPRLLPVAAQPKRFASPGCACWSRRGVWLPKIHPSGGREGEWIPRKLDELVLLHHPQHPRRAGVRTVGMERQR